MPTHLKNPPKSSLDLENPQPRSEKIRSLGAGYNRTVGGDGPKLMLGRSPSFHEQGHYSLSYSGGGIPIKGSPSLPSARLTDRQELGKDAVYFFSCAPDERFSFSYRYICLELWFH